MKPKGSRPGSSEAEPREGEHNLETLAAQPWGRAGLEQVKEAGGVKRRNRKGRQQGGWRWGGDPGAECGGEQ